MDKIKINQLFDFFKDTISKCGSYILKESDEIIGYNVFEEFDIGVVTFLHEISLKKLLDANFISIEIMNDSLQLRKMVFNIQQTNDWNIEGFRKSENWKQIINLCDKINSELGVRFP